MNRLDKELVKRNLVETRTKAQQLIASYGVNVNGEIQNKPSFEVNDNDEISILKNEVLKYVSRAGLKLEKAIDKFKLDLKDRVVVDVGSSTGGFTDCCLQNGAKKIIAVDVGTNVMHKNLRNNPQVELHENTNFLNFELNKFNEIDLFVVDVSFVSLERIVEKVNSEGVLTDMMCLIKPQFECGKEVASKFNGVIKSKTVHKKVLQNVIGFFNKNNFYLKGLDYSPIKGGDGNIEYISWFTNKTQKNIAIEMEKVVNNAFHQI